MASPYGGDRGGGRKSSRKRGGQPGNVNRRASDFLPPARDTEERRAFLDALKHAQEMPTGDQAAALRDLLVARVLSLAEAVGVQKVCRALTTLDIHRRTNAKIAGLDDSIKREALKDSALGEIWKSVGSCEACAELVDQILRGLELSLLSIGGSADVEWMDCESAAKE